MVFMLLLSDAHIPAQAIDIPAKLKELLKPDKLSKILCVGNCNRTTMEYLRRVTNDITRVRGDCDDYNLPETKVIEVEGVKIGLCHGHCVVPAGNENVLFALTRKLGVDVLVTGGSHQLKVTKRASSLVVDPGSVTGADKGLESGFKPSYVVMDVHAGKVSLWTYTLNEVEEDGVTSVELTVGTEEFTKPGYQAASVGVASSEASHSSAGAATNQTEE